QVAAAVRFEGVCQGRLLFDRKLQFIEIENAGIVKAPLDEIGCLAHRHLTRRYSRPDLRCLARLQNELATAGLDVHLSVDYAQNPNAVFAGLDMKLGASDGCDGGLVAQLHLTWLVT